MIHRQINFCLICTPSITTSRFRCTWFFIIIISSSSQPASGWSQIDGQARLLIDQTLKAPGLRRFPRILFSLLIKRFGDETLEVKDSSELLRRESRFDIHHWWGSRLIRTSSTVRMSYRARQPIRACVRAYILLVTYQRSSLRQTCEELDVAQVVHFSQSLLFEVADRRGVWNSTPGVCRSPLLINFPLCFALLSVW